MNNRGIGIIQVLIGLAVVTAGLFTLNELTTGVRKQEQVQRTKMGGQELLSFVAGQFQSLSLEKAACFCCRSLLDPLPSGTNLNRANPASCPDLCLQETPLHGYRQKDGSFGDGNKPNEFFVTVEACDVVAGGQALAFSLYADWKDSGNTGSRKSARLKFIKSRW